MMPMQEAEGVQDQPECTGKTLSASGAKLANWQDSSVGKGVCCQAGCPELEHQDPG